MSIRRITAIVPVNILETLEKHLRGCGTMAGILAVDRVERLVSLRDGDDLIAESL